MQLKLDVVLTRYAPPSHHALIHHRLQKVYHCALFQVWMESLYGCAKECPVGLSDLPCSGRGTCEFDSSTYAISCDCSNGASGDACEVDPLFGGSSSAFRNQARNWFLGIAIVALCTAAAALVRVIFLCPQSKWYSGSAISVLSFTLLISAQV